MASSSSSGGDRKYDVFLSFRGEDTRKTFVGHLYDALIQKAMNAYQDSKDLEKGNKILELIEVIEESRISIVVLSQNYASSKWCLRELAKIMDCRDNKQQIVVPIFYEVDPSHVRKIEGTFAQAFADHEANTQLANEELESWRLALARVADLSGWDSRKYEDDRELIKKVVGDTLSKWIHTSSIKANKGLVGMDSHITEMNAKLCLEVNDVRVVGIWGMGGLGKTTIAEAVYGEIARNFEHSCFVRNVKYKREAEVQEELLLSLLKEKGQGIDLQRGREMIMKWLSTRKVLVVLDDVKNFSQLKELLGEPRAFGKGCRIIVTTRDQQSPKEVDETYHPECLNQKNSRELFEKHAFGTDPPGEEYSGLLNQAVEYARGLPLALKVLGASLYDKNIHEWKDVLEKVKIIPDRKIMDVLRISFEGLDVLEQQIFLDIACVFRGWDHLEVTEILHDFHSHIGLKNLVNRALVTINEDGELDMHDLLQEMGREIVRRESLKEPGKRSRLWSFEDVDQVLTQNTATDAIECLMLEFPYEYRRDNRYCINSGAFARMTKLRVLIISSFFVEQVRGELEFLSHELRLLQWVYCPLQSLPNTFIPKNLVILDMSWSRSIKQLWEGTMPLQNLKVIRLNLCQSLVKIPDLTKAIHLKKLYLEECSSLLELHSSISALPELEYLTLEGCEQLKILPSSLHLKSLVTLDLYGCLNLEKFPEISDVMSELQELHLSWTAIKELPESINNLTGLRVLDLSDCKELTTLPSSIHLSSLRELDLSGCFNLQNFPEISGIMKELSKLVLDGTAIKGLPSSIDMLKGIKNLSMRNCKSLECLPDSICNLAQLTHLDLSGCSALHNLPEQLGDLQSLAHLQLLETGIKHFPLSILRLHSQLDRSSFDGCEDMAAHLLSWSSLIRYYGFSCVVHLDLSDCNLLELSDGIADLSSLKTLKLCRNNLESLPVTMNRLGCLTHLELEGCNRLKSIPELSSINFIDAHCCTALETVSTPKIVCTDLDFRFSNCHRLVQTNLFTNIVETRFLDQDFHPRPLSCYMCFPGSEIPNWFSYQSRASSVTVQLPPNWFDKMFLGFAICVVSCFNETDPNYSPHVAAYCYCTFKGNQGEHNFSFPLQDWDFTSDRSLESDHMFMAYVSWSKFSLAEESEPVNECYYTEATFNIIVESTSNSRSERHCMTSYGVRFFHGNYDVHIESMTHPTDHVELGAPSFPDQLELIKSETESEAESSETAGGRGICQTLEILPEPLTGIKEKFEIMLAAAQGEGCHVSGSVCCCVSLSGCNMSMRRREAQREGDRVTMDSSRADISELGSHRGLVVPNSHYEGQEETEMMGGEESLPARGLLGLLCSCFLPVWKEKVNYGVEREK